MKKRALLCLLLLLAGYAAYLSTLDESKIPPLHNGDVIFQTTSAPGAMAIGVSTGSLYIHTGILKQTEHGWMVIHAARVVGETPLHDWIEGGVLKRFAIYRDRELSPQQADEVVEKSKAYYGKPYDNYFYLRDNAIYCSELVYDAYKDAGASVGTLEKIGSLYINNRFAKQLIEQRWRGYPACQGKDMDFEQCYDAIMAQELISPVSIAHDPRMGQIFSNYP